MFISRLLASSHLTVSHLTSVKHDRREPILKWLFSIMVFSEFSGANSNSGLHQKKIVLSQLKKNKKTWNSLPAAEQVFCSFTVCGLYPRLSSVENLAFVRDKRSKPAVAIRGTEAQLIVFTSRKSAFFSNQSK